MTAQTRLSEGTGEAKRWAGDALTLHHRVEMAYQELLFYRGYRRHRTASETNIVKTHSEWRADCVELYRALADALVAGALEPEKPKADE